MLLLCFSDKPTKSSKQDRKRKSDQIVVEIKPDVVSTANKRSKSLEARKARVNEEIKKDPFKTVTKSSNALSNCKSDKPKIEQGSDRITRKQLKDSTQKNLPCKVQTKECKSETKPEVKTVKSGKTAKDKTVKPVKRDKGNCDRILTKSTELEAKETINCDKQDSTVKEVEKEESVVSNKPEVDTSKAGDITVKCDELTTGQQNVEEHSDLSGNSDIKQEVECSEDNNTSEKEISNDTDDNMHFMKQRLLANNNTQEKSPTPNLTEKIDVNQSVTEQLTKLVKSETSSEDHLKSTSSPPSKRLEETRFENVSYSSLYSNSEIRSNSRASEHSGISEDRRSGSQTDKIKNSPSSSPLVLDKSEPVHPYRDPELMKKNTVHSNVQSMHPKMPAAYPGLPIPPPQSALPSASSYQSSLPRSHLSQLYHPLAQLPAVPSAGLGMDHATYAAFQQQQLLQYQLLLQSHRNAAAYPANLTQQLEMLWQQKNPSTPIPQQWKHQEELIRDLYALKEREIDRYDIKRRELAERERIEQEHMERIERDKVEREQRERQIERERQDRERLER